jgi:hypothetical protein
VVNNGSGQVNKLNELFPTFYATKVSDAAGKTRAQVVAELAEAQRTGDIAVSYGSGQVSKLNEQFPTFYPTTRVN